MSTDSQQISGHGGTLAIAAMQQHGIDKLFTLSGGHIFPLYDAAVSAKLGLVDVRHEQTAAFAAEGYAKLTRRPAVAALTAGPGVTNAVSAMTSAWFNGSPVVVVGGRAPQERWGAGSLQELDHVPIVASITKSAVTATTVSDIGRLTNEALAIAATPHRGPTFVDYPLDLIFAPAETDLAAAATPAVIEPDTDALDRAATALEAAKRPAILVGGDVYWAEAFDALHALVEAHDLPAFANGLGRGCLPADHRLSFSRTRRLLSTDADVVIVAGTPLDFRLAFGDFGDATVIHLVDHPDRVASHAPTALSVAGDMNTMLSALAQRVGNRPDRTAWVEQLTVAEAAAAADSSGALAAQNDPILPTRIYGELLKQLDRDAVVIGDGGDFVSYAGRYVSSYEPGCWLDPGPYGCLGTGMGYAIAARLAHPDRQVVLMLGDGAAGFSLMDADSLVRHNLAVVIVIGNNGIWGLEKHPMQMLYGYDVAAELQPECRYDQVVEALGGAGEVVTKPGDIAGALSRAFASGVPYVVNVLTDPADMYPRRANLA